jgi:type IV pilus assembly protein PilA
VLQWLLDKGASMKLKHLMRGLSFIEVTIAFAITSVLVAAAMPNFQDFTVRARVIEGLEVSHEARDALVRTCMADEHALVSSNVDAGYRFVPSASGENFVEKIVLAADCANKYLIVMVWTANTGADPEPIIELRAKVPSVTADGFEEPYYWNCRIIRGEFAHVPDNCRKHYRKG